MKITDFDIRIDKENVLGLIDCKPDCPVYEAVLEDFEEVLPVAYEKLAPSALLEFGDISGYDLTEYGDDIREALFCIESVGSEISTWTTSFFHDGNYVKGMLANAIADDYLFQMDYELQDVIVNLCKERNLGVLRRLEAPQDISIEAQRTAWEVTRAEKEIGLGIKESFMLNPVKSNCQIYLVKKDCDLWNTAHDCSKCPRIDCKMKNRKSFMVTVKKNGDIYLIEGKEGENLMEILQHAGIYLYAVCGGRGTCGKCKVKITEGLEPGIYQACKTVPNQACTVSLMDEDGFVVVTDSEISDETKSKEISLETRTEHYGIGVDIGTTTIAMQLIELGSEKIVDTYTDINRQIVYGADVISRILASNEGKKEQLKQSILDDLEMGVKELLIRNQVTTEVMAISGNTTMLHLLMGYSCETLGVYPFTPVNVNAIETDYLGLFGNDRYICKVRILPGISTYVGGDIIAGLLTCKFDRQEKVSMLIDLGTNGEMAIGNKDRILVTSTAAGPAFEGGNIICGTGSIPGAISHAVYKDNGFEIETIGNKEAIGICGTGVIDITYELLKHNLIDETGLLDDEFFEGGILLAKTEEKEIRFYQKDVREIQLAKSAVRAGIETLLVDYGVSYDELDAIYIAGGFGYKIDIDKAVGIGLLPGACKEKMKAIGNSSLKGSILYLKEKDAKARMEKIVETAEEVQLASSRKFNDFYMHYMYF